jgi:hypothetical protein
MADGFYSGIMRPRQGSRPIDASIIGQERMQRRKIEADKQSQEREQQEALKKEVMKSLDINPQFSNNFFNMDFNSDMTDVVTNVVEMYAKGDPYAANYGMTQARRLKNKANTLKTFDQNWEEARAAVDAAHSEGHGHLIDNMWEYRGKTYNNVIEVFNDPSLYGDPKAYEDAMQFFEGADPITKIQKQPQQLVDQGSPEYIAYFDSPKLGAIVNPAQGLSSMLKSSEASQFYTEERDPFKMNLNGVNIEVQKLGIPFQQGMRMVQSEYSKSSAQNYIYDRAKRDYMEANPDNPRSQQEFLQKFNTDKAFRDNIIKTYGIDEGIKVVESAAIRGEKVTSSPKESAPSSGSVFGSDKVEVFKGEDVIKAQAAQPWETGQEGSQSYQYLAVAPIQLKKSVLMNTDIKAGTLYWDQKAKDGKGELRAPKGFESSQKVVPHELVVMSDGQKERPYIRFLLAGERKENEDPIADIKKIGLSGSGGGEDKFTSKSFESFYVPATDDNLKRLAAATETGIDKWKSLVSELEKTALQGRRSASSGGAFINQGGGVAPQQNPASGVIGKTANKAAPSGGITADEFNKKWATLKSGQSLVGPDGKTYKKP